MLAYPHTQLRYEKAVAGTMVTGLRREPPRHYSQFSFKMPKEVPGIYGTLTVHLRYTRVIDTITVSVILKSNVS